MGALRRYLLVTVSAAALSTSALAADIPARMPVKAPPPVAVPWSWAGFYIGVHAGAAWNHAAFADLGDNTVPPIQNRAPVGDFWKPERVGFIGGGQIGYNFQSGNVVYGLEADFSGVSNKHSTVVNPPATFSGVNATTELSWMATVRGRLGVTLSPPTLLYITGGLAVAHFKDAWGTIFLPAPEYTSNKTRTGWTVGGGIEYMFTRNVTAKVEALYADFDDWTVNGTTPANVGFYRSRFEHQVITVRGGLNWKW
jgi:outer membrane immunogenic protein